LSEAEAARTDIEQKIKERKKIVGTLRDSTLGRVLVGPSSDPMGMAQKKAYKDAVGASVDADELDQNTLDNINASSDAINRSYQGVTTGPKGPGTSKAAFIAEQLKKGKDQATAKRMADQIFGQ
jgi:hypothetical protein